MCLLEHQEFTNGFHNSFYHFQNQNVIHSSAWKFSLLQMSGNVRSVFSRFVKEGRATLCLRLPKVSIMIKEVSFKRNLILYNKNTPELCTTMQ